MPSGLLQRTDLIDHQQHPLPLAEPRRHRRVPLRLLRSGHRPERGLRRRAPAIRRLLGLIAGGLRRARLPVQGQADLQVAGHAGLPAAPGLHLLAVVPDVVPHRHRRHRSAPTRRTAPPRCSPATTSRAACRDADGKYHQLADDAVDPSPRRRARPRARRRRHRSAASRRTAPALEPLERTGAGCSI